MRDTGRDQDRNEGGSRALVVVQGGRDSGPGHDEASSRSMPSYRADAAFLAQLLAVRTHAPAQRAKRRAAPEVGAAAYESGLGLLAAMPRRRSGIEA